MCIVSHMTYLINHVICLNNTCGWSYELQPKKLQQDDYKLVCRQTQYI
jgi:hypothetical protein